MADGPLIPPEQAHRHLVQLVVVRALLGRITPEMHAVSVDFDGGDQLTVHFALTFDYAEFEQDMVDILFKVETQFTSLAIDPLPRLHVVKHIGDAGRSWPGFDYPSVYLAKTFDGPDKE